MSSTTWTTREVASKRDRVAPRVVARGRGAARGVDDGARRFGRGAARAGAAARRREALDPGGRRHLHWLLFTPFRYPPPPGGSRFRGPNDPGVFYGADEIRTACAELGYWRWRHLAGFAGAGGDADQAANGVPGEDRDRGGRSSREAVRARSAALDRRRTTTRAARRSAGRRARRASARSATNRSAIRSVRACCAVLSPAAFVPSDSARAADVDAVGRPRPRHLAAHARARRRRARIRRRPMVAVRALGRTEYEPTWRAMQAFTAARAPRRDGRDLAHRASAGVHARRRRPARAPAARQRHPGRSRSIAAGRSPITARGSSSSICSSTCATGSWACARWSGRIETAVIDWLARLGIAASASPRLPAFTGRRGEDRRARAARHPRLHATTASRSTSTWISPLSPTSTRAAIAGSR